MGGLNFFQKNNMLILCDLAKILHPQDFLDEIHAGLLVRRLSLVFTDTYMTGKPLFHLDFVSLG